MESKKELDRLRKKLKDTKRDRDRAVHDWEIERDARLSFERGYVEAVDHALQERDEAYRIASRYRQALEEVYDYCDYHGNQYIAGLVRDVIEEDQK